MICFTVVVVNVSVWKNKEEVANDVNTLLKDWKFLEAFVLHHQTNSDKNVNSKNWKNYIYQDIEDVLGNVRKLHIPDEIKVHSEVIVGDEVSKIWYIIGFLHLIPSK